MRLRRLVEPLTITTWLWGDRFDERYVENLFSAVGRHLKQPHRRICFVDRFRAISDAIEQRRIPNPELVDAKEFKGCCARLRMFDPEWQASLGLVGRIVTFDLDCVVMGELDSLFDRADPFTILQEVNINKVCPFNGSLQMLRTGTNPGVWSEWEAARDSGVIEWSDENWLAQTIPNAASWTGRRDGVWSMHKQHWPGGLESTDLPENARVVFFTGKLRKPMTQFQNLPWFRDNWK